MTQTEFVPNLFILGAAKSGTTTLHAQLGLLDDVCMSHPKEPFFFECEYAHGLEFYRRKYFRHWRGERVIGEARHRNLYLSYVPQRVYETNPLARLIVVLRHPAERAYSHWWHWRVRGREELSFPAAIAADHERIRRGSGLATVEERQRYCASLDASGYGLYRTYIDSGYYLEQLERYLALFGPEQLLVLLLRDLSDGLGEALRRSARFLGIPTPPARRIEERFENVRGTRRASLLSFPSRIPLVRRLLPGATAALTRWAYRSSRPPPMDPDTRAWLVRHYRDRNRALEEYLERDLSHWDE